MHSVTTEAPSWLPTFVGCGMIVLAALGWIISRISDEE